VFMLYRMAERPILCATCWLHSPLQVLCDLGEDAVFPIHMLQYGILLLLLRYYYLHKIIYW